MDAAPGAAPTTPQGTAPGTINLQEIEISTRRQSGDPNSNLVANCTGSALCGVTAVSMKLTLQMMQMQMQMYAGARAAAGGVSDFVSDQYQKDKLILQLMAATPAIMFQMMHNANQDDGNKKDNQTPPPVPATTTTASPPDDGDNQGGKDTAGEPIAVATGEYLETWRDFRVQGAPDFDGARYMGLKFSPLEAYASPFGACQASKFDEIFVNRGPGELDFYQSDGRKIHFDRPFNFLASRNAAHPHLDLRAPWLKRLELSDRTLIKHFRQYDDDIYRLEKIEDLNGNTAPRPACSSGRRRRMASRSPFRTTPMGAAPASSSSASTARGSSWRATPTTPAAE